MEIFFFFFANGQGWPGSKLVGGLQGKESIRAGPKGTGGRVSFDHLFFYFPRWDFPLSTIKTSHVDQGGGGVLALRESSFPLFTSSSHQWMREMQECKGDHITDCFSLGAAGER